MGSTVQHVIDKQQWVTVVDGTSYLVGDYIGATEVAIQAAIDAVADGGHIVLKGTFTISNPINLLDRRGITIEGSGPEADNTKLTCTAATCFLFRSVTDGVTRCTLRDLWIDGSGGTMDIAIHLDANAHTVSVTEMVFERLRILNSQTKAIHLDSGDTAVCHNITLRDCLIDNGNTVALGIGIDAPSTHGFNTLHIQRCRINSCVTGINAVRGQALSVIGGAMEFHTTAILLDDMEGTLIQGVYFENNTSKCIDAIGTTFQTRGLAIIGCFFNGFVAGAPYSSYGLHAQDVIGLLEGGNQWTNFDVGGGGSGQTAVRIEAACRRVVSGLFSRYESNAVDISNISAFAPAHFHDGGGAASGDEQRIIVPSLRPSGGTAGARNLGGDTNRWDNIWAQSAFWLGADGSVCFFDRSATDPYNATAADIGAVRLFTAGSASARRRRMLVNLDGTVTGWKAVPFYLTQRVSMYRATGDVAVHRAIMLATSAHHSIDIYEWGIVCPINSSGSDVSNFHTFDLRKGTGGGSSIDTWVTDPAVDGEFTSMSVHSKSLVSQQVAASQPVYIEWTITLSPATLLQNENILFFIEYEMI